MSITTRCDDGKEVLEDGGTDEDNLGGEVDGVGKGLIDEIVFGAGGKLVEAGAEYLER